MADKPNKWQKKYNTAKENLKNFKLDLQNLYSIQDLDNRSYQLKVLKEKYGMDLDQYHQIQVSNLEESKKILTSRYVIESPNPGMKPEYTNDASATKNTYVMGANVNVEYGTTLNSYYNEELDLKSQYNVNRREKDGSTYESDLETQKQNEFTEAFNYGTAGNTDAWGRDYDHPDYGIDPSSINRTIVTPTPVGSNNSNNSNNNNNNNESEITEEEEEVIIEEKDDDAIILNPKVNLGSKDGDLVAVNNQEETPKNRLELMTESIRDNPSRIQKGLIESGFTPERLAGLKIKHEDWKAERRNRRNLQVEAKT
tara:strand:- start:1436 stop:2371 length:936 start_codon:yes stop_codon:yes gene_type:complete